MITIVDYGLGNLRAFCNVYRGMNIKTRIARNAEELNGATRIILPGVGAFDEAMQLLTRSGMRETLNEMVLERRVPVLGICVGMQVLAGSSDEGGLPGLGWIPARVRAFKGTPGWAGLPLPHMGWNDVVPVAGVDLFREIEMEARFYFLHSYFFDCEDARVTAATTSYGLEFASAVRWENVYGVQFHPEKSHHWGTRLLRNFAEIVQC